MKKILILGGTGFVGRILTENLSKTDNNLTLFNRGKRNEGIFPGIRRIKGDRDTDDIKQIGTESWDVVIDFSCMFPDSVDSITDMLKDKVGRYIFVSTCSVYPLDEPEKLTFPIKETEETLQCTPEQRKDKDVMSTYGQKKAECERVLLGKQWLDAVIFRPALIYGRYDPSDRFYYWLYKVYSQLQILLPDNGISKFTSTHSEDFAALIQSAIDVPEHKKVYNATTHDPVSFKELLDITSGILNKTSQYVNAPAKFLEEHKVTSWMDMPGWIDGVDLVMDNSKALKDFPVKFQTFAESVKGSIDYYTSLGWPEPKYGLKPEREGELIKKLLNQ